MTDARLERGALAGDLVAKYFENRVLDVIGRADGREIGRSERRRDIGQGFCGPFLCRGCREDRLFGGGNRSQPGFVERAERKHARAALR